MSEILTLPKFTNRLSDQLRDCYFIIPSKRIDDQFFPKDEFLKIYVQAVELDLDVILSEWMLNSSHY